MWLVAIAANSECYREILGIVERAKEDKVGMSGFLKHLTEPGLSGVQLIISDACMGLAESAAEFFPDAAWQGCVVHFYRNRFSYVPRPKMREVAAMLKAIHAAEDIAAAREKALQVIEKQWAQRLTRAAELTVASVRGTFACYGFPEEHWRRVRTNNPLARILREIRRRKRVVGSFPDGAVGSEPCRPPVAPRRRHRWSKKRYLSMDLLAGHQMTSPKPAWPRPAVAQPKTKKQKILDSTYNPLIIIYTL